MENSVIIDSVAARGAARPAPDRRSVAKWAVGFVVGIAIIAGLAHALREDPAPDTPVVTPRPPVEVTRPPMPPAVVTTEPSRAAPEPRRSAPTKRARKKAARPPASATTRALDPSPPETPSPTPNATPSRTDLDAPLPH